MRALPAVSFLIVAGVLGASLARAGASLNLPAPVVPPLLPADPPALPRRPVLLVVIDGLRADEARRLPFIGTLAAAGARARLWDDTPTYSTAEYVALLAGVPPRDSGVRTNETIRAAAVDDVALRARDAGMRTVAVSTTVDWWTRLFPRSFVDGRIVPTAAVAAELAPELAMPGAGFVLVHLCDVDGAGHRFGARSAEYRQAAERSDEVTAALARAWGWPNATVVVTADHGHRDGGGHGGGEPEVRESFLVAAGPGIEPGARVADARTVDVAPTLAAMLAVPSPAEASGRALVDLLHATAAERAALAAADDRRLARVAAATAEARAPLARAEARSRIQRAIGVALALALGVWALSRQRRAIVLRALLRGLAGLAASVALFLAVFGPVSLSAARQAIYWGLGIGSFAFAAAAIGLLPVVRRRQGTRAVAAVVAGFAPPALAAYVYAGLFATRLTCEPPLIAAGPPFAYALLAGACLAGAVAAAWLGRLRPLRSGST